MLPTNEVLRNIEIHADDAEAIAQILHQRPDLIEYANGVLHEMGRLIPYEIAQILYACALQPDAFAQIRSVLEYFTMVLPPQPYPAEPTNPDSNDAE